MKTLPSSVLPSETTRCRRPVWTKPWNAADVRPSRQKPTETSAWCSSSLLRSLLRSWVSEKSLKEIAAKHNRGFYISLIDGLPIESSEKKRLLRDADIQEAEIVEDLSDEPTDIE